MGIADVCWEFRTSLTTFGYLSLTISLFHLSSAATKCILAKNVCLYKHFTFHVLGFRLQNSGLQSCGTVNRVTILTDKFGSPKVRIRLLSFLSGNFSFIFSAPSVVKSMYAHNLLTVCWMTTCLDLLSYFSQPTLIGLWMQSSKSLTAQISTSISNTAH